MPNFLYRSVVTEKTRILSPNFWIWFIEVQIVGKISKNSPLITTHFVVYGIPNDPLELLYEPRSLVLLRESMAEQHDQLTGH